MILHSVLIILSCMCRIFIDYLTQPGASYAPDSEAVWLDLDWPAGQ